MRLRTLLAPLASLALLGAAPSQPPNESLFCPVDTPELGATRYLRALSLDLRGDVPTADELTAVVQGAPVEAFVDEFLASPGFGQRVVRRHRELLWNNVTTVSLFSTDYRLSRASATAPYYRRGGQAAVYRGENVGCDDEPAAFAADGSILFRTDGPRRIEGWVEVAPYWAPDTRVRVCAFDAQEALVSPAGRRCGGPEGTGDRGCGCGPSLRYCNTSDTHRAIQHAFAADVERRILRMTTEDLGYRELLTGRTAFVNGPLVHFYRYMTELRSPVSLAPSPVPAASLPELAFHQVDEWRELQLPDAHSGVLTSPAYLLRFQTNRARANRFYNAFLCQPFQPAEGGIPVEAADAAREPDLQLRDGCRYCHAMLEPAAAYWGRWTEQGTGFLAPAEFPPSRADCEDCGRTGRQCSDACRRNYVVSGLTPAEEASLGMLRAYQFRRPEHVDHVEFGPRLLVDRAMLDDRLPRCVAQSTAEWLLGRPLTEAEAPFLDELSRTFTRSGHSYRALVRAIVTSDTYRRVR